MISSQTAVLLLCCAAALHGLSHYAGAQPLTLAPAPSGGPLCTCGVQAAAYQPGIYATNEDAPTFQPIESLIWPGVGYPVGYPYCNMDSYDGTTYRTLGVCANNTETNSPSAQLAGVEVYCYLGVDGRGHPSFYSSYLNSTLYPDLPETCQKDNQCISTYRAPTLCTYQNETSSASTPCVYAVPKACFPLDKPTVEAAQSTG